ncbi:MAG: acyl carrier protein [Xanthomonadaceae bacterium]|nr:acyl carrier protein [Xanthomonadaceae bacterium]MDP2185866.1 acyl carrier protein [Xanthomonadales bacterium]MDZ4117221.1 acyl carrier protein [Xanthomonadaceae bacterium]MDZ4378835.1 acyl carrier protein [Xanthomonadaceae bacterium]
MNEAQITEKVVALITPYVKNPEALKTISKDTSILADLGVNSARLVDIVLAFEDEFDIEVSDDAADSIATIGDAVNLIGKLVS